MLDVERKFQAPPRNMVQDVRNIIEGYDMGPLRALAQDPVQNSYDARRANAKGPVRVDYRLHERQVDGSEMLLLTVTDRNTSGLRGIVGASQVRARFSLGRIATVGRSTISEEFLDSRPSACQYCALDPLLFLADRGRAWRLALRIA